MENLLIDKNIIIIDDKVIPYFIVHHLLSALSANTLKTMKILSMSSRN
ncbi:hypothetical protein NVIRPANT_00427 [Pantoea sp. Nvir]|nr:hypothetical protein NVIRPANT_00427 [Pantoea sp. Nvir]